MRFLSVEKMKKKWKRFGLLAGLLWIFLAGGTISAHAEEEAPYVPGEVLIFLDRKEEDSGLFRSLEADEAEIGLLSRAEDSEIFLAKLPDGMSVEQGIEKYGELYGVRAVTPNYVLTLYEDESKEAETAALPNDTDLGLQNYLDQAAIKEAWEYHNRMMRDKVRVAVLDTGADLNHPDLKNVINRELSREILDSSGRMGPLLGDDYISGEDRGEGNGHGTHVCGILAAQAGNLQGIAGAASCLDNSAVELVVIDIFSGVKTTSMSYLMRGLEYASGLDVKVINLSLGVPTDKIREEVVEALEKECSHLNMQGITLVCASGNDGENDNGQISEVPADYDSTIAVVSVDSENRKAYFSNYGTRKDIAAPGVGMYSTLKNGTYGVKSGTSMSSPIVAAAAAMMYSLQPDLTPDEIKETLKRTASDTADERISNVGVINCALALEAVESVPWIPYRDVRRSDWYCSPISFAYREQIMTGLDPVTFGPVESLARAHFALLLYRMSGMPSGEYSRRFPDVEKESWYEDAVLWAADAGVVTGYGDTGYFGPGDRINREQMVVMLFRYIRYRGYDTGTRVSIDGFGDAKQVNEFAAEAMEWAVGNGIIVGKDQGTRLDPQGYTTRAECAQIIERFMGKYGR